MRQLNKTLGSIARATLDVTGKLWALPNTIVGLALGLTDCVAAAVTNQRSPITIGNNAIQFLDCPLIRSSQALALGNVILYGHDSPPEAWGAYGDPTVNIGLHEKAHTYQSQVLGILFLPVYLSVGGFTGPMRNPLEAAAQRFGSGLGSWWPWKITG